MASFNAFKQMVLVSAGFGFDPLFAEIDRALFLGHDPWRVTHAIFSPMATYAIDRAYHGWFAPMSLGVLLCAFGAPRSYRLRPPQSAGRRVGQECVSTCRSRGAACQ